MIRLRDALLFAALTPAVSAQAADPLTSAPGGALVAEGPGWSGRFDGAGATMRLADPSAAALTVRLADWGRAGHVRRVGSAPVDRGRRGEVRYTHDGIVERYRMTRGGFEQSFVVARRPAGAGDLVLGILVTGGDLRAPACEAAHRDLQFRGADGVGVTYGAAVAFGRGQEPTAIATRYDGAGRIELVVPAALLDAATWPLTIDPAVSPLFNPGGAAPQDHEPDAAQALLARRYMVVWRREGGANDYIRGQVWNDDGTPASGTISITTSGDSASPCVVHTVVGGADRFCVVYERNARIEARLYDLSGNAVTPGVVVSTPPSGTEHHRPSASAMDDTGVMVAWDSTPYLSPTPKEIQVQLLSFGNGTIYGGVVRVLDTLVSGFCRRVRLPKSHVTRTIAGAEFVANRAVWERSQPILAATPTEVWTRSFALLAPSGLQFASLSSASRVVSTSAGGDYEEQPDIGLVASTGVDPSDERFLIAWQGGPGDITAALYDLSGPIAAPIDVSSTGDYETEPAVLAGACEFSVGYRRIGATQRIAVRTFRPDGTELTTSATTLRSGTDQYYAARGASRHLRRDGQMPTNRVLFVWEDSGGPSGGLWDVQARYYQGVAAYVAPFGVACPGPGGTMPQISTVGLPDPGNDGFGLRVDNAPPNSLAALVISTQLTTTAIPGAPGCALYAGVPFLIALPAVTDGSGSGTVALPIPCNAPPGVVFAMQWGVYTPGHNAFGWIVSDDVDLSWGL